MRVVLTVLIVTFCGCILVNDADQITLAGPYTDYDALSQAELPPFPPFSERFIHFEGTSYVLHSVVSCRTQAVDTLHVFELLELDRDVDVKAWITYYNADFGNEYTRIEPQRHALQSGEARLADVRVEEQEFPYRQGQTVTVDVMYYRLDARELRFENAYVPLVQTEEHRCFIGDGFGGEAGS